MISGNPVFKTPGRYYSRSLRPGSKVCSEHIDDWQYLSLGDQEQNEGFPKGKSSGFYVP